MTVLPHPAADRFAPINAGSVLAGPFAPAHAEVDVPDLTVVGELPAELDGAYVRNGPNPRFSPIGSYVYPLDGDGMLHRVTLSAGRARYDNRFVRTPMLLAEERAGHALWPGFASPWLPDAHTVGPELAGRRRDKPDINIVRHRGTMLALAEGQPPYRIGPDLATLGQETFGDQVPGGVCAHPKIDPATGEMLAFTYHVRAPYLTWTTIRPDGSATPPAVVDGVDRPSMIHDMAITPRYVVLVVAPLFFDVAQALRNGSRLSWEPEAGTRIAVIPRDGGPVRWCHDDAFWVWHLTNAHEQGNRIVIDYAEWATPTGMAPGPPSVPFQARAVLDPAAGTVRRSVVSDVAVEFPRIDDRLIGQAHQVSAFSARSERPLPYPGVWDALAWHDHRTGTTVRWEPTDLAVGEPAFAPGADGGWWLTYAVRVSTDESCLLVIPAADPGAGPVATVQMPVRVPLGLHGNWLPS